MYTLSNGLLPEALNELYVKKNKIHHYPTRNCDNYHIQTRTDSFSNVTARILECNYNTYLCKYLIYAIQERLKIMSS